MKQRLIKWHHSIPFKLILTVGSVLLISISMWSYFNIGYQKNRLMENIMAGTDRLTNTIRLGTQYAMMLNSRDDITQIIANIAKQPEIENIRIYNKYRPAAAVPAAGKAGPVLPLRPRLPVAGHHHAHLQRPGVRHWRLPYSSQG
jgi:hypothetical protein